MVTDILHVITGLGIGGAENILTTTAIMQKEQGYEIKVISLLPGGEFRDVLEENGVEVVDLGMMRGGVSLFAIFRLIKFIRVFKPRIVQSWMYHADLLSLLGVWGSGKTSSIKLFWGIRCSDLDLKRYSLLFCIVLKFCVWMSRFPNGGVIANSETGKLFHQQIGYHPKTFYVVDNGIDTERFSPDHDMRQRMRDYFNISAEIPVFALIGRSDPMKDQQTFLDAFSQLSVKAMAVVAGAGTEKLPVLPNVLLLGKRTDIDKILKMVDFIVSSSAFGEGFSNAVAEGMSCGLPPIVTDVGDSKRIVGDAGKVIPPGNVGKLTEAMMILLRESPAKYDQRAKYSRERIVQQFSRQKMIDCFFNLYGFSVDSKISNLD